MVTMIAPPGHSVKYFVRVDTDDYDPRPFLAWIRPQMARREWNGADLARRLGKPAGTVARWLRGERRPDPRSCDLLADVFNADVDELLSLVGHRPKDDRREPNGEYARFAAMLKKVDLASRGKGLESLLNAWIEEDKPKRAAQAPERGR